MTLIDTSAWIEFFRGRGPIASQVDELVDADEAALCGPVVTELRRGFATERERRKVLPLLSACKALSQPTLLWEEAGDLGFFLARKGVTVKTLDLLIAVHALAHDSALLTKDRDFAAMRTAGVALVLV